MPNDPNEHAQIRDTTEDECFDRWEGVDWQPYNDDSGKGTCLSDYDFDSWAEEYEGDEDDA